MQAGEGPSLRGRMVLAVVLTAVFYAMALLIGVVLLAAPTAVWASTGTGNIWITVAGMAAGLAVLRAIVPARDKWQAPGLEVQRETQPRLFAVLDDVAASAAQRPADHVFLDLDVNASVAESRGRRHMVLGLPLMAALSEDELRAVLAHELGHYAGGDTRVARWLWRTRVAVLRTVDRLATAESWFQRKVVRWPFQAYAIAFLRITNAVSRREEFAADAFSARVAGADAAGRALRRLGAAGLAFDAFWHEDVAPMLSAERRPPLAPGFRTMLAQAHVAPQLDEVLAAEVSAHEPDPYASHPTLGQRLGALGLPAQPGSPPAVTAPAVALLDDLDGVERELLAFRFGEDAASLRAVSWNEAAAVHLDGQRALAQRFGAAFPPALTLGDAGACAVRPADARDALRERLHPDETDVPDEALDGLALDVLAALVVAAAADNGARVTADPGAPLTLVLEGAQLWPWRELSRIAAGEAPVDGWREHPLVARLAGARLRSAVPVTA